MGLVTPGFNMAGMVNPPTGMGPKGSSEIHGDEEADPLAISEKECTGQGTGKAVRDMLFSTFDTLVLADSIHRRGKPRGEAGKQDGECIWGKVNLGCLLSCCGRKSESRNGVRN